MAAATPKQSRERCCTSSSRCASVCRPLSISPPVVQFALLHPSSTAAQLHVKARALVAANTEHLVGVGLDERAVRCVDFLLTFCVDFLSTCC